MIDALNKISHTASGQERDKIRRDILVLHRCHYGAQRSCDPACAAPRVGPSSPMPGDPVELRSLDFVTDFPAVYEETGLRVGEDDIA